MGSAAELAEAVRPLVMAFVSRHGTWAACCAEPRLPRNGCCARGWKWAGDESVDWCPVVRGTFRDGRSGDGGRC